jgi:hypothetical protein
LSQKYFWYSYPCYAEKGNAKFVTKLSNAILMVFFGGNSCWLNREPVQCKGMGLPNFRYSITRNRKI